jgi:MFS family permease
VAAALFAGATAGTAILWTSVTATSALLTAVLLGLAIGAESDLMPFLVTRYFGISSMGELFGYVFGSYTLGNATGRYVFAVMFDSTGSYRAPLAIATILLLLATAMTSALGRYPDRVMISREL